MRKSLTIIISAALVAVGAPVAGAAPGAAEAPPPTKTDTAAESTKTFTLLTGDVVTLTVAADGSQRADVVRDVAPRGDVSFQEVNGDLYALTPEAVRLSGQGKLDLRLFDLTALASAGYDDAHTAELPVIATYDQRTARAAAAPAGTRTVRTLPSAGAKALGVRKDQAAQTWPHLVDGVAKMWLDGKVTASLDVSVPAIGAPEAWQAGFDGTGVTVAVLDTGVDTTHPDLADRVAGSRSFVPGEDVTDGNGHGTHVASTVVGSGAASAGTYRGVAPGAQLLVGKVLDNEDSGQASEIIAGMEWAAAQGAKVISMSLGGNPTDGTDPLSAAVNRISTDTGALFVIAAGNEGTWTPTGVNTPGAADLALTVGNVLKTEPHDASPSSSVGPRLGDFALKPEITAPGTDIVAARAAAGEYPPIPSNDAYTSLTGTSMATPHVAGAAAILAQEHPDWSGQRLKDALVSSATPNKTDPVTWQGGGMVDLRKATTARLTATSVVNLGAIEPPHPVTSGTVTLRNPGTEAVHADLAMTVAKADKQWHETAFTPPDGAVTLDPPSVDVPAGGEATVKVSVDFAHLDTASYYGRLTARDHAGDQLSQTMVSWTKDVQRHGLTVRANDRAGIPANTTNFSLLHLINLDTGEYYPGWFDHGVGVFAAIGADPRLPEGKYAVLGNISEFTEGPPYTKLAETVGGDPELALDRDRTVVIDARKGEQVRFTTPRAAVPVDGPGMDMQVVRVVGEPGYEKARLTLVYGRGDMYVLPSGPVTIGKMETTFANTLVAEDLTMTLGGKSLGAQYPRWPHWGDCASADLLFCVPPFAQGRQTVVDAGTGTPAELTESRGRVAFVREVPAPNAVWSDQVDITKIADAAAAAGATGVVYAVADAGPANRWVEQRTAIPFAVVPKTGGDLLAAELRKGPATVTTGGEPQSSYVYNLLRKETGRLPSGHTYRFGSDNLATVSARYHADVPGTVYRETRYGPARLILAGRDTSFRAPFSRTEYVSPDVAWKQGTNAPVDFYMRESASTTYSAGQRSTEDHFGVPVGPQVSRGITTSDNGPDYSSVWMSLSPFVDGPFSVEDGGPPPGAFVMRYLRDGQLLCEWNRIRSCDVAPVAGRYRVELDTRLWQRPLGSRTHTVWEAGGPFGSERPTMNLRYAVPVDLDNTVGAGSAYTFSVDASYVRTGPGGIKLEAWASHDGGATWTALSDGNGTFTVRTPRDAKSVAIRVRAEDRDGNVVDQTVLDAWKVRAK